MRLDDALIRRLETLARLEIGDAERGVLRGELERIVDHVSLVSVRSETVSPATGPPAAAPPLRPDEVQASLPTDTMMNLAPAAADGHYRLPPVLPLEAVELLGESRCEIAV